MPEEPITPKDDTADLIDSEAASTDLDLEGSSTTAPEMGPTAESVPDTSFGSPPTSSSIKPVVVPAKKPRKKGLIVGIIAASIGVVFGGGSILAYNLWYENPQKVITDALVNAVRAKTAVFTGNVSIDSNGTKVGVAIDAKGDQKNADLTAKISVTFQGKVYNIDASAVTAASGDIYLKASNLGDVAALIKEQFASSSSAATLNQAVDKLVAKIDGTWIKISTDELKIYSDAVSKSQTCINDASKMLTTDPATTAEIANLYQNNQFILINKDLGSKDGSIGYELGTDKEKATAFAKGLVSTKIYKSLHDCDATFTINPDDLASSTTSTSKASGTVQVWVDAWSHQFTKVDLTADSQAGTTVSASIKPVFDTAVTVDVPSSSTTLTQLQSDLTSIYVAAL